MDGGGKGPTAHERLMFVVSRTTLAEQLQQLGGGAKETHGHLRRSKRFIWAGRFEAVLAEVRKDFADTLPSPKGHHARYLPARRASSWIACRTRSESMRLYFGRRLKMQKLAYSGLPITM